MTIDEKIKDGIPYVFDNHLMDCFNKAFELTRLYNATSNNDVEQRAEILSRLLGRIGENVTILPDFHCQNGYNIIIGDNVTINFNCTLMDNTEIIIGNNVLIGPNTSLYTVNHAINPDERRKGVCVNQPIRLGNGVWLGGNVVVMPGVTIGDNTIIGAGSVVTRSIPSNVVAAGNPCRIIRESLA